MGDETVADRNAAWWSHHLAERAEHERARYLHQERRAQLLAGVGGGLVAFGVGLVVREPAMWTGAGWAVRLLGASAWGLLLISTAVLWAVQTPMKGHRFPPDSAGAWFERVFCSPRPWFELGIWRSRGAPTSSRPGLSAAAASILAQDSDGGGQLGATRDGRRLVAAFLADVFKTDLDWWVALPEESPDRLREIETRIRLVFWFWACRDVAERKAALVRLGMTWASAAVLVGGAAAGLAVGGGAEFIGLIAAGAIAWGVSARSRARR